MAEICKEMGNLILHWGRYLKHNKFQFCYWQMNVALPFFIYAIAFSLFTMPILLFAVKRTTIAFFSRVNEVQ